MSLGHGAKIATNGLILCLDDGNSKSFVNAIYRTDDLAQSTWVKSGLTLEEDISIVSPTREKVYKLTSSGVGSSYLVQGYQRFQAQLTWCSSIYVKAGTYKYARLSPSIASNADGVTVDLETGVVIRKPYSTTYENFKIDMLDDGWIRISRIRVNDTYSLKCFALYMTNYTGNADAGAGTAPYYPNAGEYFYISAPQFEFRNQPSEFQPNPNAFVKSKNLINSSINFDYINQPSHTNDPTRCLTFDGTNDYLYGTFGSYVNQTAVTIIAMINVTDPVAKRTIFTLGQSGLSFAYGMVITNNQLQFRNSNSDYAVTPANSILPNIWYHLVITSNPTGSKGYINGVNTGSITQTITNNTAPQFTIARRAHNASSEYFSGKIGQLSIYDRELSEIEIRQNFEATRRRYGL